MPLGANRIAECSFPRVKVSPLRISVSCLLASPHQPPFRLSHLAGGSLPRYRFTYSTLGTPRREEARVYSKVLSRDDVLRLVTFPPIRRMLMKFASQSFLRFAGAQMNHHRGLLFYNSTVLLVESQLNATPTTLQPSLVVGRGSMNRFHFVSASKTLREIILLFVVISSVRRNSPVTFHKGEEARNTGFHFRYDLPSLTFTVNTRATISTVPDFIIERVSLKFVHQSTGNGPSRRRRSSRRPSLR